MMLGPIFNKPLRTLSILVQTAYLDALTFCLSLRPPLLTFTPDLLKVLQEALAIAEAEDVIKIRQARKLQLLTSSRVVAIELMSVAMSCSEFHAAEHHEFRNRIIAVFFKNLTVSSKEIVLVSKKGLSHVIIQHKLPKELLQSSLRPVLLNLADHRKLSVPLLKGLSRLLELLTNCFNVTLGEKLLEHLNKWTEPAKISAAKIWKEGEDIKIAAHIIHIFHLLPPAAVKFLDPLVSLTNQLEQLLPREGNNPYREPLVKFLNRYYNESVDYFLRLLHNASYAKMFNSILHHALAEPLRAELAKNPDKIIAETFRPAEGRPQIELEYQGILLVRTLVKFMPGWLGQHRAILDALVSIWNSELHQLRTRGEEAGQQQQRENKYIVKCMLSYCRSHPEEVDTLFYMVSIFKDRSTLDYSFLQDFYAHEVAEKSSLAQKKAIMYKFVDFFTNQHITQEHKVKILQVLIIPLLNASFVNKDDPAEIVDPVLTSVIANKILDCNSTATPEPVVSESGAMKPIKSQEDSLSIELLQLATLLVRYMKASLMAHKKELIKFAWFYLKSEDATCKQCAHVLVCRFIEAYETPPKIIMPVYSQLLRAYHQEARSLVREALDILTPTLDKRLPAKGPWIKGTRKIMVEEGHAVPNQLIHILQLLTRHPLLFYRCRALFVPHIVHSLARIGLMPNSTAENRRHQHLSQRFLSQAQ
eukprot:TRINITY_DN8469_c0_g1_i2.p1 TRINITY_DN8469_c0_g1~~TRINITY_DN8469_c0_g1_i2.p1  ORF type:complete len:748 (+),score=84.96 TRINITY_DN8469_c0_g1_i2:140-2245(+)